MTGKLNAAAARSLAALAFLCAPSSSHAAGRPEAFDQLELQSGGAPSAAPQPQPGPEAAAGAPVRAAAAGIGAPLDRRLLEFGEDIRKEAKADWEKRLKENGGLPSLVPLPPLDPARDILLCIPGHGQNFQDVHELAKLSDTYQVLVAVVDDGRSMDRNAKDLADIADALAALSGSREDGRGPELRLVGHSMGGGIGQLLLQELVDRKKLYDGPGSVFSKVIFVGMDSIWRGVDAPWLMAPGIGPLSQYGIPSLANGGPVMVRIERVIMPANVTTHFITIHHKLAT
ncbi:MAG TPA: hypothetical protein PL037_06630, partial [Elusimicrobiales bacterium]|nr:hypothetical protein [Elusimicrobiales bacterium]